LPPAVEGALDIFKTIMSDTERWVDSEWNASTLYLYLKTPKTRIQFKSFDTVKAKQAVKGYNYLLMKQIISLRCC
jgi:hypothetical protein